MNEMITRFLKDEHGLSALETAIILIAFVVVAAIFAFSILSGGISMTEHSKQSAYAGLAQVRGSMELKGSVVGFADTITGTYLEGIALTVANVAGGAPIDFTPPDGAAMQQCTGTAADNTKSIPSNPPRNALNIFFRNTRENVIIGEWSVCYIGSGNSNRQLEDRELFRVWIPLNSADTDVATNLGVNERFTIEIKPPSGATLVLERTTPPTIQAVMDLN